MNLLKLELKSFRGATKPLEINFDSSKNISMIFGENGNGKSTIADGIVCLCTETLGSLEDRSSTNKSYLISSNANFKDTLIKLHTSSNSYTAQFGGSASSWVKVPSTGLLTVRQLRRSQITSLIDAQPAKRYEELRSYIDVSKIENAENLLNNTIKEIKRDLEGYVKILSSTSDVLEKAWQAEGAPGSNFETWAQTESLKDLNTETERLATLTEVITAIESISYKLENIDLSIDEVTQAKYTLDKLQIQLNEAKRSNSNLNENLLKLLEEAKLYISGNTGSSNCPLCSASIDREKIIDSINSQIESMSNFQTLVNSHSLAEIESNKALSILKNAYNNLDNAILSLIIVADNAESDFNSRETQVITSLKEASTEIERRELIRDNQSLFTNLVNTLKLESESILKTLDQFNLINEQYEAILENREKLKRIEKLKISADNAYTLVSSYRKQFIDSELSSISDEVDRLYQVLHPGEPIGDIKLSLKEKAKSSLNLSGKFYTYTEIPPQALYSESHLDTLGICIFFALAKKYNDGNTILVLDDVVMSVDHNHLDRFIELLHQESSQYVHILVTTHYRPWRDRYRHHRAPEKHVHFIELNEWSLDNGIKIQTGKNFLTDLNSTLSNSYFDRQLVAGKAGIFLEDILEFLTMKYSCKLPRKPKPDYTLGELLDGIGSKRLLPALEVEHFEKDISGKYVGPVRFSAKLKDVIDSLKGMAFIRNQVGAHFNLGGSMVSDAEIRSFAEDTLKLAEMLICPDFGVFPTRGKSGSYHETPNGSIRLHPFKEPT
jgi:recombinational DNA repair ATPase RecF